MTETPDIVAKFIPVTKPEADTIRYLILERILVVMDVVEIAKSATRGTVTEQDRDKLPKELKKLTNDELADRIDYWLIMVEDLNALADKFSPKEYEDKKPAERTFEPISTDELKAKIEYFLNDKLSYDNIGNLIEEVSSDLGVEFDTENIEWKKIDPKTQWDQGPDDTKYFEDQNTILGYCTLPNGFSFLGICGGGDWEVPVHFIIYWDGLELRAYVPKNGNFYNTDTKKAYGNSVSDVRNLLEVTKGTLREGETYDSVDIHDFSLEPIPHLIKEDIAENIKLKEE